MNCCVQLNLLRFLLITICCDIYTTFMCAYIMASEVLLESIQPVRIVTVSLHDYLHNTLSFPCCRSGDAIECALVCLYVQYL
jgi:hypothetical protein